MLEQIKDFVEFLAEDAAQIGATLAPYALAGLLGLYVLWLVIGYLRVSQVGLEAHPQPVVPLPARERAAGALPAPAWRAVLPVRRPRCTRSGATFCTACERDLLSTA